MDYQTQFDAIKSVIEVREPDGASLVQVLIERLNNDFPDDSEIITLLRQTREKLADSEFKDALPLLEQAELLVAIS